ncbi:MAG: FAD-dependent thymidylate synthase [Deltaproteobacteria bacterium]|nr:FAD-dependent thymidylate synthase [Deltaproteobacteria bacterium]
MPHEPKRHPTGRAVVPAMEAHLLVPVPCLDHGFVRLVDYMGDDSAIVEAARVSFGGGTRAIRKDRDLVRYLLRNGHTSPFEMCEIKLHVKLPIFVARQWVRHRTASLNELSGRYSVLDRDSYLPAPQDLARQSTDNRQGRGEVLDPDDAARVLDLLRHDAETCHATYDHLLEQHDLARELARIGLPLSTYTQWTWKIDLHNLLHFLRLRLHPHAQQEIRVYATAIADLTRAWVPLTWEAFEDYVLHAVSLSRGGLEAVRRALRGEPVDPSALGLGRREWEELHAAIPEVASPGPARG